MTREQIGLKIKEYREENNLSQKDLADRVGYSKQMISCIERGTTDFSLDKIRKIADVFCINVADLIGDYQPIQIEQAKKEDQLVRVMRIYKEYMSLSKQERRMLKQLVNTTEEVIRNEQQ